MDWKRNKANLLEGLRQAREEGVSYVCTPELGVTGYECEDNFLRPHLQRTAWEIACEIAAETNGWNLIYNLGLPVPYQGRLFNASAMVIGDSLAGLTAKRALAGDGNYYEPRQFKIWPRGLARQITMGGGMAPLPIGDIHYLIGNLEQGYEAVGLEICEEAWLADRLGASLKKEGVLIVFNPSGSHF
jgi:NAD+ synthase (glutamine-hydrolysing)